MSCQWCGDKGRKRKLCPLCGLVALGDGRVAQMVGSVWMDVEVPIKQKKKEKKK